MVEKRKKNLNKYGRNNKLLLDAVMKIVSGDLHGLNIKKMAGENDIYRCRVGKLRIILRKEGGEYGIVNIGTRGDVYK